MRAFLIICLFAAEVLPLALAIDCQYGARSYDGTCYDHSRPEVGAAGRPFRRLLPSAYADGLSAPREGPNARIVDRAMGSAANAFHNMIGMTQLGAFFGQYFAHGFAHSRAMVAPVIPEGEDESHIIRVPVEDETDPLHFCPAENPECDPAIAVTRLSGEDDDDGVRQITNGIAAYMDLNQIYGQDAAVNAKLRAGLGGRLRTKDYGTVSAGDATYELDDFLPNAYEIDVFVDDGLVLNNPPESMYGCGDFRCTENGVIAATHGLWLKRHNQHAGRLAAENAMWDDETVFQAARNRTIAEYQHVSKTEFFRMFLGETWYAHLAPYRGYNPELDPRPSLEFSVVAFRGHSAVPEDIPIYDNNGNEIDRLPLATLFHGGLDPLSVFARTGGPGRLLWSMAATGGEPMDGKFSQALMNMHDTFSVRTANIVRSREVGLPGAAAWVDAMDPTGARLRNRPECADDGPVDSVACFMAIAPHMGDATLLRAHYGKIDRVDPYVALSLQSGYGDSMFGLTQLRVLYDGFDAFIHGDPLWYENAAATGQLTPSDLDAVLATSYADIISEVYDIPRKHLPPFVFLRASAL